MAKVNIRNVHLSQGVSVTIEPHTDMSNVALVIFSKKLPERSDAWWSEVDTLIAPSACKEDIEHRGKTFLSLEAYQDPGSIYEARALAEELSLLKLKEGNRLSSSYIYKGFPLWWTHYDSLFYTFCLPYIQHKRLLELLRDYTVVYLEESRNDTLYREYLSAYGVRVEKMDWSLTHHPYRPRLGVVFQIPLTIVSWLLLLVLRKPILLYTSDEFDGMGDYNFRMKFIYEELRKRKLRFVEYMRSMESWKILLNHAWVRRRPVIYTDPIKVLAHVLSLLTPASYTMASRCRTYVQAESEPRTRFLMAIATHYLSRVHEDIWAIRITRVLMGLTGVKAALIIVGMGRNFYMVIACKLSGIPTVGILHGVESRHFNLFDFMTHYDGDRTISVDRYGLWSDWWMENFLKDNRAYTKEQLCISGPMRPVPSQSSRNEETQRSDGTRVLFVSEIVAVPEEVVPYLERLLREPSFVVSIKFRAHNDIFEAWLMEHRPDLINAFPPERRLKCSMYEAITTHDSVVGSQSTGVIEATMQEKPFVFFHTKKWGDYFDMASVTDHHFFARTPEELVLYIKEGKSVPKERLSRFALQFFGDSTKNGSAWTVDEIEKVLKGR